MDWLLITQCLVFRLSFVQATGLAITGIEVMLNVDLQTACLHDPAILTRNSSKWWTRRSYSKESHYWRKPQYLDCPVKAFQALSGDAIVCEVAPISTIVPIALQEGYEGLADDNVIRSRVVVQLLMPVLQYRQQSVASTHPGTTHNEVDSFPLLGALQPANNNADLTAHKQFVDAASE